MKYVARALYALSVLLFSLVSGACVGLILGDLTAIALKGERPFLLAWGFAAFMWAVVFWIFYELRAPRNLGRLCLDLLVVPIARWREFEKILDQCKREPK